MNLLHSPSNKVSVYLEREDFGLPVPRFSVNFKNDGDSQVYGTIADIGMLVEYDPLLPNLPLYLWNAIDEIYGEDLKKIFDDFMNKGGYPNGKTC